MTDGVDDIETMWIEDSIYIVTRAAQAGVSVEWYVHHMLDRLANRVDKLAGDIDWLREKDVRCRNYKKKIDDLMHNLYVETGGAEGKMKGGSDV